QLTYISCKVVNNTSKQIIKRREDFVVDMFSDEDIDGSYISPLQTTDILLKAKPVVQNSEWYSVETENLTNNTTSNIARYFSTLFAVKKFGIDDTLSFISSIDFSGENFNYISAE